METEYISNDKEIVFLNNRNIAHKIEDINGSIAYNAIPSLSLFNNISTEIHTYNGKSELSAYGISCIVQSLSANISSEVSSAEKRAFDYTEKLSTEFRDISAILRGTVTIIDKNENIVGNDLSVRRLTNDKYDELVDSGKIFNNELYIIDDSYHSARGQQIRNLAEPYNNTDAATKNYVDTTENTLSNYVFEQAKAYANSISSEPLNDAKDYADANFADYDNFEFTYDNTNHLLKLCLNNKNSNSKELTVDATYFISNGIVDHIETDFENERLIIYWKNSTGTLTPLYIPLDQLVTIYREADNGGIKIAQTTTGYVLSCDDTIVRRSTLDNYQEAGDYVETASLNNTLKNLSVDLSSDYLRRDGTTPMNEGKYTTYLLGSDNKGGIQIKDPNPTSYNCTTYGFDDITIVRNSDPLKAITFSFIGDNRDRIIRARDLENYVHKSIIYNALSDLTADSTFTDVITALVQLKNNVNTIVTV